MQSTDGPQQPRNRLSRRLSRRVAILHARPHAHCSLHALPKPALRTLVHGEVCIPCETQQAWRDDQGGSHDGRHRPGRRRLHLEQRPLGGRGAAAPHGGACAGGRGRARATCLSGEQALNRHRTSLRAPFRLFFSPAPTFGARNHGFQGALAARLLLRGLCSLHGKRQSAGGGGTARQLAECCMRAPRGPLPTLHCFRPACPALACGALG